MKNIKYLEYSPNSLMMPYSWVGHLNFAYWLVNELKPDVVVELGTHTGNSYFTFCQSIKENRLNSKCYAVDTWQGDEHAGEYSNEVFEYVNKHNLEHYAAFSTLMRTTFDDAKNYFSDKSIQLLHIDGLHTYEAVKHDFETWLPKLKDDAIVLFHDTMVRERDFGVWKLWEEIVASHSHTFEFHHSHGLGVLKLGSTKNKTLNDFFECNEDAQNIRTLFSILSKIPVLEKNLSNSHDHIKGLELLVSENNNFIQNSKLYQEEVNNLNKSLNEEKLEKETIREKNQKISKEFEKLKDQIDIIKKSRSWRYTIILRKAGSVARAFIGIFSRFVFILLNFKRHKHYFISKIIGFLGSGLKNFDSEFYLKKYPDVALSKQDPLVHYLRHGRREGRLPNSPKMILQSNIETNFNPSLENVLIVSHEASRTGAPILSLNVVRILKERYNMIVLLLGGGELVSSFRDEGAIVIGPCDIRHDALMADQMLVQLLGKYQLKFALVNSIESRVVLPVLAKRFVPSLSLLHEFASYTRPRDAFREAFFWSGEAIFSSNLTLQSALNEYPDLGNRFAHVIPQGRCLLPQQQLNDNLQLVERERIRKAMRPLVNGEQPFIVLGAGYVQIRKGVDLFIECAARVVRSSLKRSIRFVWVGKGYDPENEVHYSVYLADQIERAGLTKHITFIDETSEMDDVYKAADMLLLTSRLDPLPNVAIDALSEGLPVMCFDKSTGIADILAGSGLRDDCVAEYLDTHALAEKIIRLAEDNSHYQVVAAQCKQLANKAFSMENYVRELENIAKLVAKQSEQEAHDMAVILDSDSMDLKYFCTKSFNGQPLDEAIRGYVRAWAVGIGRRKPFPGFHPGIYLEQHGVRKQGAEPLADYLRSGSPDGPWRHPVIRDTDVLQLNSRNARVALHLHVFYPDLLPAMLERIDQNVIRPDLFISVGTGLSAEYVAKQLINYTGKIVAIEVVQNRGRDIGPFLTTFGPRISANYDFVGHLHTKKSADVKDASVGADWYEFLLENLLGGMAGGMMDRILSFMINSPSIGMVFPDDPNVIGWSANRPFAEKLAERLGITELPEHFVFPVGTMFWARVDALRNFWELDLGWDDYPEEPLPYDGSILHALERLLPLGLAESANQCALTNVTGLSR